MTNPYRAMCAELITAVDDATESVDRTSDCVNAANYPELWAECMELIRKHDGLLTRARALLAQQEPEESKPVVDYSRVPEIATEAQIRSAAQYLVKKRNCDGDLIPAIEYAIARWGCPTAQPKPEGPTDEEIMELMPQEMREDLAQAARAMTGVDMASFDTPKAAGFIRMILNRHAVDHARAALAKYGSTTPQLVAERPTDEELTLTYAYAVAAAVGNKRGPYTTEDAEAAQLAGLRAVLAKWGTND